MDLGQGWRDSLDSFDTAVCGFLLAFFSRSLNVLKAALKASEREKEGA